MLTQLNNKNILLIDGVGASISGIALALAGSYFGLPPNELKLLVMLAVLFAIYSLGSYFIAPQNWRTLIKIVACLNIGYSMLTATLMVTHISQIKTIGLLYLTGECIVIITLAIVEIRVANTFD